MKVVVSPDALDDLSDIARWVARDNPARARSFVAELRSRCSGLSKYTRRFPIIMLHGRGEIRKRAIKDYLIFYLVHEDGVLILRIVHGSRDWAAIFAQAP